MNGSVKELAEAREILERHGLRLKATNDPEFYNIISIEVDYKIAELELDSSNEEWDIVCYDLTGMKVLSDSLAEEVNKFTVWAWFEDDIKVEA